MIRAAFFDIDGTLVSFTTHLIPQSTVDALTEFHKRGGRMYISTGRPIAIVNNIGQIKDLVDGYITFNGAYSFIGDTDINCNATPEEDVQAMIDDAKANDYTVLLCGKRDVVIYNYHDVFYEVFVKGLGVNNIDPNKPASSLKGQPILQLTPFFGPDAEKKVMPKMPHSISARWNPNFTDITVRGADKGHALRLMAAHEGLDISECIAFGDGGNDIPILKTAGIGVAMGNAADNVKAAADYVTTHVDDNGIANALRHFGAI